MILIFGLLMIGVFILAGMTILDWLRNKDDEDDDARFF